MVKVISNWFYEAAIQAQEKIEDTTVEKATHKAHLQSKPGENAKYIISDMRFKKKLITTEKNDDTRTKKAEGSGSQARKGSGKDE